MPFVCLGPERRRADGSSRGVAMLDWEQQIPSCFGREDLVFAGAQHQQESAVRLRAATRQASIPSALVVSAIEDWLHGETSNTGHLHAQMARVRSFFG